MAPLSLPICLAHFGTVFYFYFQHYAIQAVVVAALRFVGLRGPTVKFSAMFLAAFFAMDFAVCLYVYCRTGERVGPKRLAWSIAYGTLNTKTYFVVGVSWGSLSAAGQLRWQRLACDAFTKPKGLGSKLRTLLDKVRRRKS